MISLNFGGWRRAGNAPPAACGARQRACGPRPEGKTSGAGKYFCGHAGGQTPPPLGGGNRWDGGAQFLAAFIVGRRQMPRDGDI